MHLEPEFHEGRVKNKKKQNYKWVINHENVHSPICREVKVQCPDRLQGRYC